jgi:hypothetical protein
MPAARLVRMAIVVQVDPQGKWEMLPTLSGASRRDQADFGSRNL